MKKIITMVVKNMDGGTGTFTRHFGEYINSHLSKDYKFNLLSIQKPKFSSTQKLEIVSLNPKSNQKYSINSAKNSIHELAWLRQICRANRPDVVISVGMHAAVLTEITRLTMKKSFSSLHTLHTNAEQAITHRVWLGKMLKHPIAYLIGRLLNHGSSIVCVSRDLSVAAQKFFQLKDVPACIYNCLPNHHRYTASPPRKNSFILGTIMRFDRQKDLLTILKAMKEMEIENHNVSLIIVGDGELTQEYQAYVDKMNLNHCVTFLGWHNSPWVALKGINAFVLSSFWEGFPYSLLEAMVRGIPVIASDTKYGPNEILMNGKFGQLFKISDSDTLSKNILNLTNKTVWQKYHNLSLDRSKSFDINTQMSQYTQIIERISNENRP